MTNISEELVIKLAKLSKLKLSDDEVKHYQKELQSIISYVDKLQAINLDDYQPVYQVNGLQTITRQDELIDYEVTPKELLKNAPNISDNQFMVAKVL